MVRSLGGDNLDKDPDFHNQRLWKRKKYREQRQKDERKKVYKNYKAIQNEEDTQVDDKQQAFYKSLFEKTENDTPQQKDKPESDPNLKNRENAVKSQQGKSETETSDKKNKHRTKPTATKTFNAQLDRLQ